MSDRQIRLEGCFLRAPPGSGLCPRCRGDRANPRWFAGIGERFPERGVPRELANSAVVVTGRKRDRSRSVVRCVRSLFRVFAVVSSILTSVVPVAAMQLKAACAVASWPVGPGGSHRFGESITRLVITKVVRSGKHRKQWEISLKTGFLTGPRQANWPPFGTRPGAPSPHTPGSTVVRRPRGDSWPDSSGGFVRVDRRSSVNPNPLVASRTHRRA